MSHPRHRSLPEPPPTPRVLVVGPGRVGRALASVLGRETDGCTLAGRTRPPRRGLPPGAKLVAFDRVDPRSFDLILLTVPDDRIDEVAQSIGAMGRPEGRSSCAVMTSGVRTLAALEPLGRAGWRTARFHPVAPFPLPPVPFDWNGVPIGVQGALEVARRLARRLGAQPFTIDPESQGRYHLALSLAAAGVAALLAESESLLARSGLDRRLSRKLATGLARQSVEGWTRSGPESLTGSVARGDVEAVRQHLEAATPGAVDLVVPLWRRALLMAESTGALAPDRLAPLKRILDSPPKTRERRVRRRSR